MPEALLKLQIGPVQEFIAQARSTRDLWSGSYLLSWLMAAGIAELQKHESAKLIFPNPDGQPLIELHRKNIRGSTNELLTPNLPNLFVSRVPFDSAKRIADAIDQSINAEWTNICAACWKKLSDLGMVDPEKEGRFERQCSRHLSISWQITPVGKEDYAGAYDRNGRQLDAVRQARVFKAWSSRGWICDPTAASTSLVGRDETDPTAPTWPSHRMEKDSLTGKEEEVCGGADWKDRIASKRYGYLFKHEDWLGAITLVKRVWHQIYLGNTRWDLPTSTRDFPMANTLGIANHDPYAKDQRYEVDSEAVDDFEERHAEKKYFAVLAFDGDQIGKWVSGDLVRKGDDLEKHHSDFSTALSRFALGEARKIVESRDGRLIYAGGDDVLALLPADTAIECATELRNAFRKATAAVRGRKDPKDPNDPEDPSKEQKPDASVGIAMAHFKSPLQDVIRAAQSAEKAAKNRHHRSALAVTIMKHSGEINEWGCQWDSGGLDLYEEVAKNLDAGDLSAKFPHRVIELLEPYQTHENSDPLPAFAQRVKALIEQEFAFVCERQSTRRQPAKKKQSEALVLLLDAFLTKTLASLDREIADQIYEDKRAGLKRKKPDRLINALIGLCQTVAFAHRTRSENSQKHTVP